MMEPQYVVAKPLAMAAVQYDGTNASDIESLFDADAVQVTDNSGTLALVDLTMTAMVPEVDVQSSDWLLLTSARSLPTVATNDQFTRYYATATADSAVLPT